MSWWTRRSSRQPPTRRSRTVHCEAVRQEVGSFSSGSFRRCCYSLPVRAMTLRLKPPDLRAHVQTQRHHLAIRRPSEHLVVGYVVDRDQCDGSRPRVDHAWPANTPRAAPYSTFPSGDEAREVMGPLSKGMRRVIDASLQSASGGKQIRKLNLWAVRIPVDFTGRARP